MHDGALQLLCKIPKILNRPKLIGTLNIEVIRDGKVVATRRVRNLIPTAGKGLISNLLIGSGTAPNYISLGTGTNSAAAGDTALQTETHRSQMATRARATTSVTNDTARYTDTLAAGGTYAITEAGLQTASSAGILMARQVFTAVDVLDGDNIAVTWDVQNT